MSTSRRTLLGAALGAGAGAAVGGLSATTAHAASWQQKWAPSASSDKLGAFETIEDDRADSHPSAAPHIYATGNNWRFNMHTVDRDTSTDRQRHEVTGLRNGSGSNYLKWTEGQTWRVTYSMYIPSSLKATTTFTHIMQMKQPASEGNRVVRMTYNGSSLTGYKVLLQGIKKNRYHNGGRLVFGPDGYLYISTGEAQTPDLAQDKNSLNGKILRMTTDGKAAPGNPFNNYVYSYGHRNPQGLAFDRNGRLWEAEFGNSSKDELNLIKPGANYGWPTCEGTCDVSGMTNPKKTWNVSEASPSGIAIVRNVIYMASLRGERLWRIPITGDTENVGTATAYYVGTYGRLRTVTKVPGADQLWLSTTNSDNNGGEADGSDKIFRVSIS